ncbi:MAG: hypothetical protein GXY85_08885 [Candidatus Brocadiaceae bacterium]|nr:hypothetical protein [Candidatus Brocadiaceae bacterium]
MADSRTMHDRYVIRRKLFKVFGQAFHIYHPNGDLAFYADMKAFRLKEDIRLYTDESKQQEVLMMKARQVLDISATYDVVDSTTDSKVGALQRRGLRSMVRDDWRILDADDNEIGVIREDSTFLALVRRLLIKIIPQTFYAEIEGRRVLELRQPFSLFVLKTDLDFSADTERRLDRRLGIAAGVLLSAIEGRQN